SFDDRLDSRSGVGAAMIAAIRAGATPVLTLEPTWRGHPANLVESIARGDANQRLDAWGTQLRRVEAGASIIIEPAPEMNARFGAPWQPSGRSIETDTVEWRAYAAMWRRIVEAVRAAGNVDARWLWSPSAGNPYTHRATGGSHWDWMDRYYPGDDVVDFVGLH